MCRIIFIHVFAFFFALNFFQSTQQQTLPPKALNEERLQVLKEILPWMTLRKNGEILNEQELEPFFQVLKQHYRESKYYRTLIVAFKHGVLPKLTLQINAACDPAYPLEYRFTSNNSVTDGLLKRFIFKSYDKRHDQNRQYCDYRQGLVCNTQTKKCECPEGSKMGPISQGSTVQRCLVQENEICSLIDLAHDPTSKYGALKKVLPVMIFNLEKPLSCTLGTQCRFKSTSNDVTRCYLNNDGPWDKGRWNIDIGTECTIGLYGDTGQCLGGRNSLGLGGYTCYNFGPRSLTRSPKVGLCAHESGSYSVSWSNSPWDPMYIGFVSPATSSLRGWKLSGYYKEHLEDVFNSFVSYGFMITEENKRCNVEKTMNFLALWKFFQGLEATPPQGQDYIETEAVLKDKLKQVVNLTNEYSKRPCRVYTHKKAYGNRINVRPAYQCVIQTPTDENGNDGTCQETPEEEDVTKDFADKFMKHVKLVEDLNNEEEKQEQNYRRDLIELVELECDPKLGPPPGSEGAPPSNDNDVLEDGYCPPERGCHEDYGDYQGIYHQNTCRLKDSNQKFYRNCQSLDVNRGLGKCEKFYLENKVKNDIERLPSFSRLGRGDQCDYFFETQIRSRYFESNLYRMLVELRRIKNGMAGRGICDRTRLLECTKSGTCECLTRTAPRTVTYQGKEYTSDYCYVTSDGCELAHSIHDSDSVESEKNIINTHYTGPYWNCEYSNWCVYIKQKVHLWECTTENTGSTGVDPEPKPVVATAKPCYTDKCGFEEAGGADKNLNVAIKTVVLIIGMINFVQ